MYKKIEEILKKLGKTKEDAAIEVGIKPHNFKRTFSNPNVKLSLLISLSNFLEMHPAIFMATILGLPDVIAADRRFSYEEIIKEHGIVDVPIKKESTDEDVNRFLDEAGKKYDQALDRRIEQKIKEIFADIINPTKKN